MQRFKRSISKRRPLALVALVCCLPIAGCAGYSKTSVAEGEADGFIIVHGAPATAEIIIDNSSLGTLGTAVTDRGRFRVPAGKHRVRLVSRNQTILDRVVIVDGLARVTIEAGQ